MPDLLILAFIAVLVAGAVTMLHHEGRVLPEERTTLDVQNHQGDAMDSLIYRESQDRTRNG